MARIVWSKFSPNVSQAIKEMAQVMVKYEELRGVI